MDDYKWTFAKTELGNLEDLPYPGKWIEMKDLEGGAALDELARHEQTIAVPREMLERWREVLLAIELSNNQEWEEYPDDMREIIDSMDALLSTSAENGSGGESDE